MSFKRSPLLQTRCTYIKCPYRFTILKTRNATKKVPFSRNLEFFLKQQIDAKYRGFLRNKKFQIMYIYCFVATPLKNANTQSWARDNTAATT